VATTCRYGFTDKVFCGGGELSSVFVTSRFRWLENERALYVSVGSKILPWFGGSVPGNADQEPTQSYGLWSAEYVTTGHRLMEDEKTWAPVDNWQRTNETPIAGKQASI
jgi:hypothetical protein